MDEEATRIPIKRGVSKIKKKKQKEKQQRASSGADSTSATLFKVNSQETTPLRPLTQEKASPRYWGKLIAPPSRTKRTSFTNNTYIRDSYSETKPVVNLEKNKTRKNKMRKTTNKQADAKMAIVPTPSLRPRDAPETVSWALAYYSTTTTGTTKTAPGLAIVRGKVEIGLWIEMEIGTAFTQWPTLTPAAGSSADVGGRVEGRQR